MRFVYAFILIVIVGALPQLNSRALDASDVFKVTLWESRHVGFYALSELIAEQEVIKESTPSEGASAVDVSSVATSLKEELEHLIQKSAIHASSAYNKSHNLAMRADLASRKDLIEVKKAPHVSNPSIPNPIETKQAAAVITYEDIGGEKPLIVVAFTGTENPLLESKYFTNSQEKYPKGKSAKELGFSGGVHSRLLERFDTMRDDVNAAVDALLVRHGKRPEDVDWLSTGHSMGGAFATIYAGELKLSKAPDAEVDLITFASPLVLSGEDVSRLQPDLRYVLRITREGDIAPDREAPLFGTIFASGQHIGTNIHLPAIKPWSGSAYTNASSIATNHSMVGFREDAVNQKIPIPKVLMSDE